MPAWNGPATTRRSSCGSSCRCGTSLSMSTRSEAGIDIAGPAGDRPEGARTSLRQVLWGLVLALIIPAILVAAGGLYSSYRAEQQANDLRMQETVRALSLLIDREIETSMLALRVLATSPHIANGDFEAFYRQANE